MGQIINNMLGPGLRSIAYSSSERSGPLAASSGTMLFGVLFTYRDLVDDKRNPLQTKHTLNNSSKS